MDDGREQTCFQLSIGLHYKQYSTFRANLPCVLAGDGDSQQILDQVDGIVDRRLF